MILTEICTKKKLFKKNTLNNKINLLKTIKKKLYEKQTSKNLLKSLKYLYNIMKIIEKKKRLNNKQSLFFTNINIVSYIVNINLLKSNIIINITNLKGIPIIYCSSGIINFKGSQKTKQLALKNIIKKINFKSKNLNDLRVAVHFKGIKRNRKKILNELNKIFIVKNIKIFNLIPYNGCRPKKIRRKR